MRCKCGSYNVVEAKGACLQCIVERDEAQFIRSKEAKRSQYMRLYGYEPKRDYSGRIVPERRWKPDCDLPVHDHTSYYVHDTGGTLADVEAAMNQKVDTDAIHGGPLRPQVRGWTFTEIVGMSGGSVPRGWTTPRETLANPNQQVYFYPDLHAGAIRATAESIAQKAVVETRKSILKNALASPEGFSKLGVLIHQQVSEAKERARLERMVFSPGDMLGDKYQALTLDSVADLETRWITDRWGADLMTRLSAPICPDYGYQDESAGKKFFSKPEETTNTLVEVPFGDDEVEDEDEDEDEDDDHDDA